MCNCSTEILLQKYYSYFLDEIDKTRVSANTGTLHCYVVFGLT